MQVANAGGGGAEATGAGAEAGEGALFGEAEAGPDWTAADGCTVADAAAGGGSGLTSVALGTATPGAAGSADSSGEALVSEASGSGDDGSTVSKTLASATGSAGSREGSGRLLNGPASAS